MNWKDAPHLFANGKFKVLCGKTFMGKEQEPKPAKLIGYAFTEDRWRFRVDGDEVPYGWTHEVKALIARPISDMTDEEIKNYPNYGMVKKVEWWKGQIEHRIRNKSLSAKELLYILSIRLYPFDDDTDVIYEKN